MANPAGIPIATRPTSPTTGRAGFATSGGFAASGDAVGALSGPWCEEEQNLTITYWRVPKNYQQDVSSTLATALSQTFNLYGTEFSYKVEANYTKKKTFDNYATSAWNQSQLLEVVAVSADAFGVSYGSVNASSMGPMGTVITTRPYKNRRYWDDNIDVDKNESCLGFNFSVTTSGDGFNVNSYEQGEYIGEQAPFTIRFGGEGYPYYSDPGNRRISVRYGPIYTMYGAFATTNETKSQMISFIDSVGGTLNDVYTWEAFPGAIGTPMAYFAEPAEMKPYSTTNDQLIARRTVGVPSYKESRHDWSA